MRRGTGGGGDHKVYVSTHGTTCQCVGPGKGRTSEQSDVCSLQYSIAVMSRDLSVVLRNPRQTVQVTQPIASVSGHGRSWPRCDQLSQPAKIR